jgi:YVTN family beta-propeller protein
MADRTVRVATIIRSNTEPTAGAPTVTVDTITGVATGTVKFTDYDGDSLSYTLLQPTNGSVSYNESTGAYTYTPTQAAREQAFQTPISDTFAVRATDTRGASKLVSVTVQVAPSLPAGVPATLVGANPIDMTVAGNRLFVLNSGDGSVSVIDTDTHQVVNTIRGVGYASPMVASSDGRYLYMSQYDSYYATASVKVVDTTTGRVVKTITMPRCETEGCDLPGGGWANSAGITDIAISPDNSRVYVSELWVGDTFYGGTVTMIDTATNTIVGSTSPSQWGDFYSNIEVSPDGTRLYAGSGYPYFPTMDVLDARTLALIDTVPLDGHPGWPPLSMGSLTFSPDGKRAYARTTEIWPTYTSQTFAVIDTDPLSATYNTQIATITVPAGAQYMKVSADGTRGYVVHDGGQTVTVVDLTTNTVIGSISSGQVGGDYAALALDDDGTLYFSNYPRNAVFFYEPIDVITM